MKYERYYFQLLRARRMIFSFRQKKKRKTFMKSMKLSFIKISFIQVTLTLNIIKFRFLNINHSEYRDINKISQELLFMIILSEETQTTYVKKF